MSGWVKSGGNVWWVSKGVEYRFEVDGCVVVLSLVDIGCLVGWCLLRQRFQAEAKVECDHFTLGLPTRLLGLLIGLRVYECESGGVSWFHSKSLSV